MAQVSIRGAGPAVIVVRDASLREVASVFMDDQTHMSLAPGLYVLEASYPDGRFQRVTLHIGNAETTVNLSSREPEEELEVVAPVEPRVRPQRQPRLNEPKPLRLQPLKGLRPDRLVTMAGRHVTADVDVGTYLDQMSNASFTGHIDVIHEDRKGRFEFTRGMVKSVNLGNVEPVKFDAVIEALRQRPLVETQLRVRRKGYHVMSWAWEDMQWRPSRVARQPDGLRVPASQMLALLQVITPERSEFVAFSPELPEARLSTDKDGRATLQFHRRAQALLEFVYQGDRQAAATIARTLVSEKYQSAPLAAVGGYYLLDTGAERSISDGWWRNLARIDWLPDGAIVAGWRALRSESPEAALPLFLEAAQRGLPLFTRGLHLLIEGLWMFSADAAAIEAAERLRPYVGSARRAAVVTTFGGASPDKPTRLEVPIAPPQSALEFPRTQLRNGLSIRVLS
jgi:hypothetical protein